MILGADPKRNGQLYWNLFNLHGMHQTFDDFSLFIWFLISISFSHSGEQWYGKNIHSVISHFHIIFTYISYEFHSSFSNSLISAHIPDHFLLIWFHVFVYPWSGGSVYTVIFEYLFCPELRSWDFLICTRLGVVFQAAAGAFSSLNNDSLIALACNRKGEHDPGGRP